MSIRVPRDRLVFPLDILPIPNETSPPAVAENQPVSNKNRMTDISTFPAFAAQLRDFMRRTSATSVEDRTRTASSHLPTGEGSGEGQRQHRNVSQQPDIRETTELQFNQLALSLFALQFTHNAPYHRFCRTRKTALDAVTHWHDIPAMPAAGFKELELTSLAPEQRLHIFHSSGTTTQSPSRHFHSRESLAIYEASLLPWFHAHFPNARSTDFLMLTPPSDAAPHSSLVHMFETLRRDFGSPQSVFTGEVLPDGAWTLNLPQTIATLRDAVTARRPVLLLGTAFNFVHLLDQLAESNQHFSLPPGSSVLETGGYKSRSRVLPKPDLHTLITKLLGVPASHIICEYGMSELSSQAYDRIAGEDGENEPRRATYLPLLGERANISERIFHFPPWARAQIINPETGRAAADGETGLIRIFDLANVYSVMAVQTEDLGVRRGDGFELLGRAALAETRGCSLRSL